MPGVRRSDLATHATLRIREQRIRIGGEVRAMRERRGWTRTELARRAGIGRMVASRIERGESNLDVDVLQRIGIALDRPLLVTFGRDLQEGPADAGHLAMQELALRLGKGAGFTGSFELRTRPAEPWRSVDVGLLDETGRRVVLAECWNTFGDVGAAARSTDRK
jgi:transcriptional regulator with XRE-family HTH domain